MMTAFLQTLVFVVLVWQVSCQSPNLVFVLVDDVGWSDLNYTSGGVSSIPTPHLDQLAAGGVRLSSHYVQPTCTPSRAALMTGRYAHNTGLPFAMFPGSVAGLPAEIPTMPELLREAGYSAHMVGKWHLGFSQWSQTPVGRGFQSHVGGFMWDLESYTKVGHLIHIYLPLTKTSKRTSGGIPRPSLERTGVDILRTAASITSRSRDTPRWP